MSESASLTITVDEVRGWVQRRAALLSEIRAIDQRLEALRILMPAFADVATVSALNEAPAAEVALEDRPLTDLVLWALRNEQGGRDVRWIRSHLAQVPALGKKLEASPTLLSTSVSRLADRGRLVRKNRLYYLPITYDKIRAGEIDEERIVDAPPVSFNELMRELMRRHAKPFAAADALKLAKGDSSTAAFVEKNPNRVYSWLGRETFKNKLIKDGGLYRLPSHEIEAPGNEPGASKAEGAATSSDDSHGSLL